jgi:hypothetical protein
MTVKKMIELFINIQFIKTTAQMKYIVLQPDNLDDIEDTYMLYKHRHIIVI